MSSSTATRNAKEIRAEMKRQFSKQGHATTDWSHDTTDQFLALEREHVAASG